VLALFIGAFGYSLGTRARADVTILRSQAEPFSLEADGRVSNQVRVRIGNRTHEDHKYAISVIGVDSGIVIAPESPLPVRSGELRTTSLFVLLPRSAFRKGEHDVTIHITDADDFAANFHFNLLGPVDSGRARP
jgi:polyferredoxin